MDALEENYSDYMSNENTKDGKAEEHLTNHSYLTDLGGDYSESSSHSDSDGNGIDDNYYARVIPRSVYYDSDSASEAD